MARLLPAAFCAALGAAIWLVVDPGQALRWDNRVHNLPLTLEAFRQIGAGRLPFWNPYIWSGAPLLADPQSQALYPLMWVGHLLAGSFPQASMAILFAIHVAIGAGGMALLARTLGATLAGALLAATVFAVNPYAAFLGTSFANEQATLAWLPWITFAACRAAVGDRAMRWLAVGGVAAALGWAAGYPQLWLYSAGAAIVVAAASARRSWRGGACALAVLLIGLALSLHQIVPFFTLWLGSQRAELRDLDDFLRIALPVRSWPTIALPGFITPTEAPVPLTGNNWPYLGLATVALALIALIKPDRLRSALGLLGAFALWLTAGASGRLLPLLYDLVPGFAFLRGPYKIYSLTVFSVALLAGFGLSDVQRAPRRWHGLLLLGAAALGAIAHPMLASRFPASAAEPLDGMQLAAIGLGCAGALALAVLALVAVRGSARVPRAVGIVAVAAALLGFAPGYAVYARPDTDRSRLRPSPKLESMRPLLEPGSRWHWGLNFLTRPLHPDLRRVLGAFWRVEMTTGYSAFLDPGYARAIGMEASSAPLVTPRMQSVLSGTNRVLDVLSARQVLLDRRAGDEPMLNRQRTPRGQRVYGFAFRIDDLLLVIRRTGLPRVRSVAAVAIAKTRSGAIAQVQAGSLDPAEGALVEAADGPPPEVGGACTIAPVSRREARVVVDADCDGPSFLVFSERHDPGWSATVDGRPARLRRAYGLVLGVPVPAGQHRVVIEYEPPRFFVGVLASSLLALVLAAGVLRERRREGRLSTPEQMGDDNGVRAG